MKKILTLLLLVSCFFAKAQSIDTLVYKTANDIAIKKIAEFSATLDVITTKFANSTGTTQVSIDTLVIPLNTSVTYKIHLDVENTNTKESGSVDKVVKISNIAGKYTIVVNKDAITYVGSGSMSSFTGWAVVANGVIKLTGPTKNIPYRWTLSRTQTSTDL